MESDHRFLACSWDGVECDDKREGHVVGLHLGCSFLNASTLHPNNTLFTLSHLKTLNLSYNHLAGSPFSPQFGMLSNLRVSGSFGVIFQRSCSITNFTFV
ncbi:hypothetical protein Csa_005021 [Cucumis sativus]|nr:hypothetical protein Csa_005021 [Cucumis sativus]